MQKKILVDGLSALTDGNVALYYRLKRYGFDHLLAYRSADRLPSPALQVRTKKFSANYFIEFFQFVFLLIKEKPDLVEFYLHQFGRLGVLFEILKIGSCLFFRTPITVICTGRELLDFGRSRFLKDLSVKLALRCSKRFQIKESYMLSKLDEFDIVPREKAKFIHNGVFEGLSKCQFKKSKDQKVVLFFNSFKVWRNVDLLAEAALELVRRRNDVVFLLVGARNRNEVDSVSNIVQRISPQDRWRVQIHQMNDNREFYYGLADLFVLPADLVWLNNSVLEAMLLEVPVLLPDVEWVDKIVADGVSGFVHEHKNLSSLVSKIDYFLDIDKQSVSAIVSRAKAEVLDKFGSEKRAYLHSLFYKTVFTDYEVPCGIFEGDKVRVLSLDEIKKAVDDT
ncbi:glycosyltransferase family 4 protein [Exilibacterium tricleocarpae]|uniref:Glycosyltransferase family 4 protein n=1 Tax=Exilibacterium tricleocarpae TaxID=2591008 RepID=A0A545U429_9GAMM|nr:glycosyltransferase family 4 protein [Exilibacterium tricleocarpae]TQV84229.1 glycosyltransferase family 4 protein [Exilibacterium tricleocarpae]